jgi:hypothetical protein
MRDSYDLLGLPITATPAQIEAKYQQLLRIYNPDRFTNPIDKRYAEQKRKDLNAAYEMLTNSRTQPPPPNHPRESVIPPFAWRSPQINALTRSWLRWSPRWLATVLLLVFLLLVKAAEPSLLSTVTALFTATEAHPLMAAAQPTTGLVTKPHPERADSWEPIFSPDGRQIVFLSGQLGQAQLYLRDPQSGHLRQLTTTDEPKSSVVWSPDSAWLAFIAEYEAGSAIQLLEVQSSTLVQTKELPTPGVVQAFQWSTDSRTITLVYASGRNVTHYCVHLPTGAVQMLSPKHLCTQS